MHDIREKIVLVLQGQPARMSGEVKEFVETTDGKLRIISFPDDSPDLSVDQPGSNLAPQAQAEPPTRQEYEGSPD